MLTSPGAHLLNAHVGKGQQFDWVVIAGLEQDTLPDFRAKTPEDVAEELRVLSVMLSRARHGVVLTRSSTLVSERTGNEYGRPDESEFLRHLRDAGVVMSVAEARAWIVAADWPAIAAR